MGGGLFTIDSGTVRIEKREADATPIAISATRDTVIRLKSKDAQWEGVLPYLGDAGHVDVVGEAEGKLLVGTDMGHVECIEMSTGRSLWIYIFATLRSTLSYSSPNGMPPTMAEAAAIYRRENKNISPVSGMQLVDPPGESGQPQIIFDPDPTDPFKKLPVYLAIVWSAAALPLLLVACISLFSRIRRLDPLSVSPKTGRVFKVESSSAIVGF